jgi:hypothetical protein
MATQFILGASGKLLLLGGKPLQVSAVAMPTTAITMTPFQVAQTGQYTGTFVIQPTAASNDTAADVPVIFTFAGGQPTSVQARLVDSTGTVVSGFDWTDITQSVTVNGSTGLGFLRNVPVGTYKRQVRVGTNDAIKSVDTADFMVGPMILPWGQSNMVGLLNGGSSGTYTPPNVPGTAQNETTYFLANKTGGLFTMQGFVAGGTNAYSLGSWYAYEQGTLALLRFVGNTLTQKFGRKAGAAINPWARNGTAMGQFIDNNNNIAMLAQSGVTSGAIGFSTPTGPILANGDYRIVLWHQGETLDWFTTTRAQRTAELKRFTLAHIAQVAKFGRPASKLTFLYAIMGVGSPAHMEILRGAVLDLIADPDLVAMGADIRVGWNCIDMAPPNDASGNPGLHFVDEVQRIGLYRMAQACMNVLNPTGVPYGARGPKLSGSVVRSGGTVTLTVSHDGGTALAAKNSGSPITGWFANTSADFSGTDLIVQSVAIQQPNSIVLTVTDAGGNPATGTFYVKHCGGKAGTRNSYAPDVSNLIYDNFSYPTNATGADVYVGLPLLPTPDAIKVD